MAADWLTTLGTAMGSAWLSGINLYATVVTLGLLERFHLVKLPGDLNVLANWWVIGLAGGSVMSLSLLHVSLAQYIHRVQVVATPTTFFVGMIKAPVFAFVIAIIGCYQGLHVSSSAENIGRRTTLAVVQSIFIVIIADALFSVAFSKMGV